MVFLVEAGGDEAGELGVTLVDGEETLLGEDGRHLRKIVTLPTKNSEVKQKEKEKEIFFIFSEKSIQIYY